MAGLDPHRTDHLGEIEAQLRQALQGLRFGSIEIVVHEGAVVQIERRERTRFEGAPKTSTPVQSSGTARP